MCNMVGTTKLPFGHSPLMLCNGEVSCQTLTGKISIMRLNSHIFTDDQGITEDEVRRFNIDNYLTLISLLLSS